MTSLYAIMRYRANIAFSHCSHQYPMFSCFSEELRRLLLAELLLLRIQYAEHDHIGHNPLRVNLDLRKFCQSLYHLLQGDNTCRGYHSSLTHSATQHLACADRAPDKFFATNKQGANGRAESFGETEHHRIDVLHESACGQMQGCGGVENARAIHMHCDAVGMSQAGNGFNLLYAQHHAAATIVRVFDTDQGSGGNMFIVRVCQPCLDFGQIEHSISMRWHHPHW